MMGKIKRRKLVIPIFIILVMSLSIFSFSLSFIGSNNERTVDFKGKTFNLVNGAWKTYLDGKEVVVINDPSTLSEIDIDGFNLRKYGKVYISKSQSINLNNELMALGNIRSILGTSFMDSCFEDVEGCETLPLKKCSDATNNIGVIEIYVNEENIVENDLNCLIINGNYQFVGEVIDKLVLETLI
ncbi:MAG: hypothetical protein AABX29_07840 [Nanoarchaeota archaeon]